MNRVAFPYVLQSPSSGSAIVGATATITENVPGAATLGGGAPALIYTQQIGGSALPSNQITTDNMGRWTQGAAAGYAQYWLPEGTYDVTIAGTGLTTYVVTRELWSGSHVVEQGLVAISPISAAYTADPQDAVPVNISAANVAVTLPTAPPDGTRVQVKVVEVASTPGTYACTVSCGTGDALNIAGGATGVTLTALGQGVIVKYNAAQQLWLLVNDIPLGVPLGSAPLDAAGFVLAAHLWVPVLVTVSGSVAIPLHAGHMDIELVGGGGGAAGGAGGSTGYSLNAGGGGGGQGQSVRQLVALAGVTSPLTVTIGAGGAGGAGQTGSNNGGTGTAGGSTTVAATGLPTITAQGGGMGENTIAGAYGSPNPGINNQSTQFHPTASAGTGGAGAIYNPPSAAIYNPPSALASVGGAGIGIGSGGGGGGGSSSNGADGSWVGAGGGAGSYGNGGYGGNGGSSPNAGGNATGYGGGGGGGGAGYGVTGANGGSGSPGAVLIRFLP